MRMSPFRIAFHVRLGLWLLLLLAVVHQPTWAQSPGVQRLAGEAQIAQEPPFRVHVEIADSPGGVTGTFTTEDMALRFTGKRVGNVVTGLLLAGDPVGAAELRFSNQGALGSFDFAGQEGKLNLRRTTKDAKAFLTPDQNVDLSAAQWLEDLDELVSILTTKHGGPFEHISRASFFAKVAEARRLVPKQSGIENALLFRKLAALIGDGHTEVAFVRGRPLYPVETFWFEDGIRVVAAPPENRSLLGARLVAVNGIPIKTVADRLRRYIGQHETEWGYRSSFPWLLQRSDLLQDSGVAAAADTGFTFIVAGKRRTISIAPGPRRKDAVRYGLGSPLWERRPQDGFWHDRWPDGTVYVNWRSYDDLDARSAALLGELDKNPPRRLLIDLRDSGGGDFKFGRRFIEQLQKRPFLNRRGVLFVLLGRRTFSAAMTNIVDFKITTSATLVGEPAGAAPNGWQEVRSFYLPNSGLRVSVSTKKYEFLPGRRQVDPDVLIPARLSDWTAERDAATTYLLEQRAAPPAPQQSKGPTAAVGPQLAQVRSFAETEGEELWRGYGSAPFGFLLVTDNEESLLCRDEMPSGFSSAGSDTATGCNRYTRPPSGLPKNLLAAMPLFGPPAVIVMGTPEGTGRTEASWVRTILHEHFHQWQYALPDYFARINALDLHDGDKTGMWILNYPFPYADAHVGTLFAEASQRLAEAIAARATPEFLPSFDRYLAARQALAAQTGERNWRYLEFQLWQEGVARWTEIRLGKGYPRQDVRDSAARLEQATFDELKNSKLGEKEREVVYAFGAGEAMLLQACWPGWRSAYAAQLSLGPLLQMARTNCRTAAQNGERG